MLAAGINEQNVGLVSLIRNVKLVFPPSYAAEAVVAMAGKHELKSWLEDFLDAHRDGGMGGRFPVLSMWIAEGRQARVEPLAGRNPVLYSAGMRYFLDFDQRAQKETVAIIFRPFERILRDGEKLQYARILSPAAIA